MARPTWWPVRGIRPIAPTAGVWIQLTRMTCNDTGGMAFLGRMVAGIGDTEVKTRTGLWLADGSEHSAAELVLRQGDTFPLGKVVSTIVGISFDITSFPAGGSGGAGRVLNNDAKCMLRLNASGNVSGIFVFSEEDPG